MSQSTMWVRRTLLNLGVVVAATATVAGLIPAAPAGAAPDIEGTRQTMVSPVFDYGAKRPQQKVEVNSSTPQVVKDKIAEIQARGLQILTVSHAGYEPVRTSPNEIVLAGYPSGCGLWVLVYRNGDYVISSSLTSCNGVAAEMEMTSGLARWRGTWWNEVNDGNRHARNTQTLVLEYGHYCRGTTYTYQTTTNGALIFNGRHYTASAWDQLDNEAC